MTIADLLMVEATTLAEVAAEVIGDKGGYSAIDAANKALKGAEGQIGSVTHGPQFF